jgi:hypothetical protein
MHRAGPAALAHLAQLSGWLRMLNPITLARRTAVRLPLPSGEQPSRVPTTRGIRTASNAMARTKSAATRLAGRGTKPLGAPIVGTGSWLAATGRPCSGYAMNSARAEVNPFVITMASCPPGVARDRCICCFVKQNRRRAPFGRLKIRGEVIDRDGSRRSGAGRSTETRRGGTRTGGIRL